MKWKVIQSNELCTTYESETKNGTLTVNLDKGEKGTLLYLATTSYGIANVRPCGCLNDVGHVRVTDSSFDFKELDTSDQLICLAHGIADITGELVVLGETDEAEWVCEVCATHCHGCQCSLDECLCRLDDDNDSWVDECEDPDSDTYNCGCCKCCSCDCE